MKKKNKAALLGIFLGVFGAHRWYLGQTGRALFCMTGIGFTTGILFGLNWLLKDNESFDKKYNQNRINKEILNSLNK